MKKRITRKKLLAKIDTGKKLTRREDLFWFTKVMGLSKQEAERILAIANNKVKGLIID